MMNQYSILIQQWYVNATKRSTSNYMINLQGQESI